MWWGVLGVLVWGFEARAEPSIRFLGDVSTDFLPALRELYRGGDDREIRVQQVRNSSGETAYLLVQRFSPTQHRVRFEKVGLQSEFRLGAVTTDYRLTADDRSALRTRAGATCPDENVQFITFCPNAIAIEIDTTREVTAAARAAGYHTVELLTRDATRQRYLDYLSCPKLVGNFYDGDADTDAIVTWDGILTADDFTTTLQGKFKYWVTNIWVACQAFHNPLLDALVDSAQSKRYAAGINDLEIGPADRAAACAMKAALAGEPITESFWECVKREDVARDQWGIDGRGSNLFQWNPPPNQ